MKKKCSKCKEEKKLSGFSKDKNRKDGLQPSCKDCFTVYRVANREKILAQRKRHYEDNKDAICEKGKLYREENKDDVIARRVAYYENNRDEILARGKKYREENKETILKQKVKYKRERYANDPTFNLILRHRARARLALSGIGNDESTTKLLGCTPEQYRHHIESQFTEGMGWGQRGLWHVDHIIPLSAFNMKFKKHRKYGFHFSNCQPLWASPNLMKSDKYCPEELAAYLKSTLPTYEQTYPV